MKQFKQIREAVAGAPTRSVYDSQSGKYKTEPIGSQTTPATGTKPAEPGREAQAGKFVSARPKLPTKPTPQVTSEDIERVEEMDKSQTPPGRDGGHQFEPGPKVSKKDIEAVKKNPAKHLSDLFAKHYAKKKMKEEVEQIEEGLQQTLRKYVPGYAKAQLNKKMNAQNYASGDSIKKTVDKDVNYNRYKKVADKLNKEEVEQIEEGRPSQRHPLEGHEYHKKTDAELVYIAKDAHKAAEAMKSHNTTAENKYRDQANDSATVRYFRQKNGMPDWYKKKYGHVKEEVMVEGGHDNAGGHYYDIKNSDGTIGMGYKPGKHYPSSSSRIEIKSEPKHPLHGKQVTNGKVTGKLIGTEHQGSAAKIKHSSGMIHHVDAKDIRKADIKEEAKDPKEYGYEGDMAMNQLQTIMRHAEYLMDMMKPDTDLPEWVQSKITLAADYIQTSCDYMTSEMKESADPCWTGYKMVGMKNKNGRKVPNCVPGEGVPAMKKEEVMYEGEDPLPRETTKDGGSWVKSTKTATHYSGKKTYEYKKFDKEGKETGERHYRDAQGNHMGEAVETPPFAGPYKKPVGNVKDKSGAVHTPMSRAKDLAKKAARRQAGLKEENDKNDVDSQGFEKTNTPAKRTLSKTAGMVKDMAKSSKSKEKKASPEKFEPEPELASAINR